MSLHILVLFLGLSLVSGIAHMLVNPVGSLEWIWQVLSILAQSMQPDPYFSFLNPCSAAVTFFPEIQMVCIPLRPPWGCDQ